MRRAWPRVLMVGVAFASIGAACSTTGLGHGISISPPPTGESPSVTPSPTPSGTPAPESPLSAGSATMNLSGDLSVTASLRQLVSPSVWAPPPAPMDLRWRGSGPVELRITGTSFVSLTDTSADHTLTFTVGSSAGPVSFSSSAGECSITITPALPDDMGGVFSCSALTDTDGVNTVDARGAFAATA